MANSKSMLYKWVVSHSCMATTVGSSSSKPYEPDRIMFIAKRSWIQERSHTHNFCILLTRQETVARMSALLAVQMTLCWRSCSLPASSAPSGSPVFTSVSCSGTQSSDGNTRLSCSSNTLRGWTVRTLETVLNWFIYFT